MAVPLRPLDAPCAAVAAAEDRSGSALPFSRAPSQRVADEILQTLVDVGVDTVYGIPGGAVASLYDALLDTPALRVINTRHESGAVFMALGHAAVRGSLPCVLTTSGPGITNAITGMAAAMAEAVPMIVLGGEVARSRQGQGALQDGSSLALNVLSMVRSVTKYAVEIAHPRNASLQIRKAVEIARSGRPGPVFLSLPLDIAAEHVAPMQGSLRTTTSFSLDEAALAGAAAALQHCERGLVLLGGGARDPAAARWAGAIATALQIPVATTPKGKGLFPEGHPLSIGVFGLGGHPSTTEYLASGCDVILAVGCGLGEISTNGWSPLLQPTQTLIQIDIDPGQLGRTYPVDCGLIGPAHEVLAAIAARLRRRQRIPLTHGLRYLAPESMTSEAAPLAPARVLTGLQRQLPANTLYVADMGEHTLFAIHYLHVDPPGGFVANTGLGSMGSGIGAAIGAKVAQPDRPVVAICGDYGFQMMGMELATCVQHRIGVVFVIFNDARMRMVENGMRQLFGRAGEMGSHRVDFAALAEAVGARGMHVRTPAVLDDLGPMLALAATGVPVVLDVEIDPEARFSQNERVAQLRSHSPR